MDVQLQELIDKIKSEGVSAAEGKADEIVQAAERKAGEIVENAQADAARIIEDAKKRDEQSVQTGKDALIQAARDLLLSLQSRIVSLFDAVARQEIREALSGDALESAISTLIGSWTSEEVSDINVLLQESDLKAIEQSLRAKLAQELQSGLEIKVGSGITGGFRISVKDGSAYYNFTPAEIAAALSEFLNPRLRDILQQAAS